MADTGSVILETPRLILRRPVMEDVDAYFEFYSDPEITRHIPDAPRDLQKTREEVAWHVNGPPGHPQLGLWAAIHKETGRFIGRCGLLPWTIEGREEVEIAYALARDFWGQGLASEAAAAILRYAFEQLNITRLICLIIPENTASARVAEKIGMTLERRVDGIDGDNIPALIYAIEKL